MITFLANNVLESTGATNTLANATTSGPATRLYDRDKAPQYVSNTTGLPRILLSDAGASQSALANALLIMNHNVSSTDVVLYKSTDASVYTSVLGFSLSGVDPFYSTFTGGTSTDVRAWQILWPASSVRLKIGEIMLGTIDQLPDPSFRRISETVTGNRAEDRSRAGYVWAAKRGDALTALEYGWNLLSESNWAILSTAFAKCSEGAKPFFFVDYDGTQRWMRFVDTDLKSQRVQNLSRDVTVRFMQSL